MKLKTGIEGIGQLWSALTKVQVCCREVCEAAEVSPEILAWFATDPKGIKALESMTAKAIIGYRARNNRWNAVDYPCVGFEELVRRCQFAGRDISVNDQKYPSQRMNRRLHLQFHEVGVDKELVCDEKDLHAFILEKGLRPAQPLEFLHWLSNNQEVGVEYSILCPVRGLDLGYMYAGRCCGGGRGLHSISAPTSSSWPLATMFLGVEDK